MTGRFVKVVPDMTIKELRRWSAGLCGYEFLCINYFETKDVTERQLELEEWLDKVGIENIGDYYIDVSKDFWIEADSWLPDSPNSPVWQIFKVIQRMRELGWYLSLYAWPDGTFHADFSKVHGKHPVGVEFDSIGKDVLTTILQAAHAAWEGEE